MKRIALKKISKKAGMPPGSLIHIGEQKTEKAKISILEFDGLQVHEKKIKNIRECMPILEKPAITWIDICGIDKKDIIEDIGTLFELHPLLLEDIMNTEQRTKVDTYGEYIFIVLKAIFYNENKQIVPEQISLVLGNNYLISFQEKEMNLFGPLKERLKSKDCYLKNISADYIAYSLIDAIVDGYFSILEEIGESISTLETEVVSDPGPTSLKKIHDMKRETLFFRKSIWPLRDVIHGLQREETPLIKATTIVYLRDVYDHTVRIIEHIELIRDMLTGLLDIYLSSVSIKMNNIMKVLTIIATVFMPLTFMAGVYGMNFKYMPELEWRFGYPFILLIMVVIGITMILYFKIKKWF
ncbi:MAG TPA: magnesium/cobalt transporter CorA [Syntrophorhabdaceae bacterium]|nr:magnesium/cobalt transporter CorA [Syntrophorhabdaceae bacterium]